MLAPFIVPRTMKQALVTGASTGIGKVFAEKLAQLGYRVTVVARTEKLLKQLVTTLTGSGHSYIVADLSDEKSLRKVLSAIDKKHFDLLVNNAGIGSYGYFMDNPPVEFRKVLSLNINALTEIAWSFLRKSQSGDSLINVSSTLSFLPLPGSSVYAASKAFVTSFSESIWFENRKRGVYIMALCPGATQSEFHKRAGGAEINKPPKGFTQTAEQVVDCALKALKKRKKCMVISGKSNVFARFLTRILSRKAILSMMGKFSLERK